MVTKINLAWNEVIRTQGGGGAGVGPWVVQKTRCLGQKVLDILIESWFSQQQAEESYFGHWKGPHRVCWKLALTV